MREVLCSTENSLFLIIDHIHAKINRVCCAALAIGKRCMNVRKNKLFINVSSDQMMRLLHFLKNYVMTQFRLDMHDFWVHSRWTKYIPDGIRSISEKRTYIVVICQIDNCSPNWNWITLF